MAYLAQYALSIAKGLAVKRWEILEVIEQNGRLIDAILYRPISDPKTGSDAYQLPFPPQDNVAQLINAVLFDGFEPVSQTVITLSDGTLQKHWTFRLQVTA
jgi:hypothetical protein